MKYGLSFFKKGEYEHAIGEFELILQHDRAYVRAYNNLGYIYRSLGVYDKAIEIWTEGLRIDPSYRRLQKNITSLQRFLKSKERRGESMPIGIEDFEIGIEWLSENAELLEIREGSLFDTYVIEDDQNTYALKTPRKALLMDETAKKVFVESCGNWLRLGQHDHIVHARSIEWVSGRPFLVMEYSADGSLRTLLSTMSKAGGLPIAQAVEIAVQVCLALSYVHASLGMAHGGIRAENVMLFRPAGQGREGRDETRTLRFLAKVSDIGEWAMFQNPQLFGNASGNIPRSMDDKESVRAPSGFLPVSPQAAAPELLESISTPNTRSDVYSFGVLLYEMLTGMLPFSGVDPSELLRTMSERPPEHLSAVNRRVHPSIGSICMKCLQRNPEARPGDFFEVADALLTYQERAEAALSDLSSLCNTFTRISRFQFKDGSRGTSLMIVGGTEFSSEVGQIWEILKRRADAERDEALRNRLAHISDAVLVPGLSVDDVYPTGASILDGLMSKPAEAYRRDLNVLRGSDGARAGAAASSSGGGPPQSEAHMSSEPPAQTAREESDIFGLGPAAEYSSLLRAGDSQGALKLLCRALQFRSEALLLEARNAPELLQALGRVVRSESLQMWTASLFQELPAISACPPPEEFLRLGTDTEDEIAAMVCGLLLMLGGEYAATLETFNMIPDEHYLPAFAIYAWALARFQSAGMENIRLNSLRNADGLLRDAIIAAKKSSKRTTVINASSPHASLSDAIFLRALILEQLAEHKSAIAHFRAWKAMPRPESRPPRKSLPWTNLVQGKSMYEVGMPSEGFIRWQRVLTQDLRAPFLALLEHGCDKPRVLLAKHVLTCCEDAISRFADNAVLWCLKAKLLHCMNRPHESLECTSRALALEDDFYPAHFVRMEALVLTGRFEEARDALKTCILREPYEPLFMLRNAEILCQTAELKRAIDELKRAIAHGLDLCELRLCIDEKKLAALEENAEFNSMREHLEQA